MNIMLDVVCSTREYIRVNGEDYPQKVVKSQFLKLNDSHIDYVLTAFDRNTSNVRNSWVLYGSYLGLMSRKMPLWKH